MNAELQPNLDVAIVVNLDGDDDAGKSLENVVTLLKGALTEMQSWGAIKGFTVEVRS